MTQTWDVTLVETQTGSATWAATASATFAGGIGAQVTTWDVGLKTDSWTWFTVSGVAIPGFSGYTLLESDQTGYTLATQNFAGYTISAPSQTGYALSGCAQTGYTTSSANDQTGYQLEDSQMAKYFKAGDTLPAITDTLLDENGTALNVSGCTVYFMSRISGQSEFRVLGEATLVSGSSGQVAYYWSGSGADGDLALAGSYQYEWEVHRPGSSGTYTVPTSSWGTYTVYDDIGTGGLTATQTSGTVNVSATFLDTTGVALGAVPPGAKVFAYLGTQPVAVATGTASGNFSLTLVDGLNFTVQAQWPGYTFGTKSITT